jgi:hypothetical protein
MTYPVLVVPTPATLTSLVVSVFNRAPRMRALAASMGRYRENTPSFSFSWRSCLGCVLIRRQLVSLSLPLLLGPKVVVSRSVPLRHATTEAQVR